jgi:hypothetical protein
MNRFDTILFPKRRLRQNCCFHQRCERRAAAGAPHRQWADPGAGAGTAFAAGPGEPQGQTRLGHPGPPARLWVAPDRDALRGEGRSHRPAGEPLGAGRHHGKRVPGSFGCRSGVGQSSDRRLDHRGRHHRGEDLSRGAQGRQSLGPGSHFRCRAADRSAVRACHGSRKVGAA